MPAFGRERRLPILVERRPWGKSEILRVTGCGLKREFTLSAKSRHSPQALDSRSKCDIVTESARIGVIGHGLNAY